MHSENGVDDTTKKLLKGMESPAQQLMDAYEKTGVGMLQKELKKLESPLKQHQEMLAGINANLNQHQHLRDQMHMLPAAVDKLRQETLAGVEATAKLQRDVRDQIAMASSAIDSFRAGANERLELAGHLKRIIPNIQIHHPTLHLAQQLKPLPWLVEYQRTTAGIMQGLSPLFEAIKAITEPMRRVQDAWQERMAPIQRFIEAFQRTDQARQRVEATGWLAHVTTPFEELEDIEDDEIPAALEKHYQENWQDVQQVFLDRLDEYTIEENAKATFRDALRAHEHGIYRATALLMIPVIERVIRKEYYGGTLPNKGTSVIEFREDAKMLPFDAIEHCAFGLYDALDYLYDHCNSDEDASRMASKPIPNRHAVVHGWVTYNCMCSSLNMLILADFAFGLVTEMKRYKQEAPVAATA